MGRTSLWSAEKLAAQVLMPRLNTNGYFNDEIYKNKTLDLVRKGVGGFCVFGGKYDDVIFMVNELQSFAEVPLIFSADMENGLPMRFEDGTEFPHHMALGESVDSKNTYQVANAIAKECKNMGITWNLAPVADINSNINNTVINIRAFGEKIETVSAHVDAYIEGTQSENVLACAKHFPGHGDTDIDSHIALPLLEHTKEKIFDLDLIPFKSAIGSGVKSIMVGHLSVPNLDDSRLPASLSKKIINILRNDLGFNGLIISDALEMKSVSDNYTSELAATMSIEAGNDVVLMPEDSISAIEGLINKAKNDDSFKNRLIDSSEKLYNIKRWCGLIPQFAKKDFSQKTFMENQKLALRIADKTIKYQGNANFIPIDDQHQFAAFAYLNNEKDLRAASRFYTMLAQATENDVDFAFFDKNISDDNIEEFRKGTESADFLIFPIFLKGGAYSGSVDLENIIVESINKLSKGKSSIAILFGNPYIADKLSNDLIVKAYSDSFASLAAVIVHLTGRREAVNL